MLPFGVTIPATVPQGSEIPEGLTNNPVCNPSAGELITGKVKVQFTLEQATKAQGGVEV